MNFLKPFQRQCHFKFLIWGSLKIEMSVPTFFQIYFPVNFLNFIFAASLIPLPLFLRQFSLLEYNIHQAYRIRILGKEICFLATHSRIAQTAWKSEERHEVIPSRSWLRRGQKSAAEAPSYQPWKPRGSAEANYKVRVVK